MLYRAYPLPRPSRSACAASACRPGQRWAAALAAVLLCCSCATVAAAQTTAASATTGALLSAKASATVCKPAIANTLAKSAATAVPVTAAGLEPLYAVAQSGQPQLPLVLPEEVFPEIGMMLRQLAAQAPELMLAHADLLAARAGEQAALGSKLPQVQVEASVANRNEFRDTSPHYKNSFVPFGVGRVTQSLYHWGALDARRDLGKLRHALAQENYAGVYRLMVLRVRSGYLEWLHARLRLETLDGVLRQRRDALEAGELQAGGGTASSLDLERAQLDVLEAQVELQAGRDHLEQLAATLRLASGWRGDIPPPSANWRERLERLSAAPEAQVRVPVALPPSARYRDALGQVQAEAHNYAIIDAQTLPRLDLVGEVWRDRLEDTSADSVNRVVAQVYLRVRWNIFDGWQTSYARIESRARSRALQMRAQMVRAQDEEDARRLLADYRLQRQRQRVQQRRVQLDRAGVARVEKLRALEGEASEAQLRDASHALEVSRMDLLQIDFALLDLQARLLALYSLDPHSVAVPPLAPPSSAGAGSQ